MAPGKSAAAAAYLARLDKLIADLQATHDAASANYTAFSTVTLTLATARTKLKPILEQYELNEQLNVDWQAQQNAAAARSDTSTLTPTFKLPPVSAARQEELNNKARAIMYDLSSTVISGRAALKKPALYKPDYLGRTEPGPDGSDIDSTTGLAVPPVIPSPGTTSGGGHSHSPISDPKVTPIHPMVNTSAHTGSVDVRAGTGPTLGGVAVSPVVIQVPPNPSAVTPLSPMAPPGTVLPGLIPGLTTPSKPGDNRSPIAKSPDGTRIQSGSPAKTSAGSEPTARMAMPSGGVIGATPGSGMIGQMPASSSGTRPGGQVRANPFGGVIGQSGGGAPHLQSAAKTRMADGQLSPPGSLHGQRASPRNVSTQSNHWDPDDPWTTEQGVDPVVVPPDDQGPIDPGPAIGYSR